MPNFKKTTIAVLMLTAHAAHAGSMGISRDQNYLSASPNQTGWELGAHALYLQSSFSNINSTTLHNTLNTGPSLTTQTLWQNFTPSWGWGFDVEGAYHFDVNKEVRLSWSHLYHQSSTTKPITSYTGHHSEFDKITITPQWDAANAELGQSIHFNDMSLLRLHAGVQYAHIDSTFSSYYSYNNLWSNNASTFNGFGPRVGLVISYGLDNLLYNLAGVTLYAKAATAILVGPESFNTQIRSPYASGTTSDSQTSVVPEIEAKLGAQYTYVMSQGELSFDLGWLWNTYFSSQYIAYTYSFDGGRPPGLFTTPAQSNFGLQGLYFGLKWVM